MTTLYCILPSVTIVTGENDVFELSEGGGAYADVTIAEGTYYVTDDGTGDDLLKAIETALEITGAGNYAPAVALSTSSGGIVTLFSTVAYRIRWGNFDGTDLGYSADLTTSQTTQVSDQNVRGLWIPDGPLESIDEEPRGLATQQKAVGGQIYTYDRSGTTWEDLRLVWSWLEEAHVEPLGVAALLKPRTLYRCWRRWRDGRRLQLHTATLNSSGTITTSFSSSSLVGTYILDEENLDFYKAQRHSPGVPFYTAPPTVLRQYVA